MLRLATPADAEAVRAIYAPYVEKTAISFETAVPSGDEMARRIATTLTRYPWLVWDDAGRIVAYAYAGPYRPRAAYDWSVDVTVYVAGSVQRRGLGRRLYTALFALLVAQGFSRAHAGITLPNPASVALHEAMGFRPVGVHPAVGFKLGSWHDVGWWQRPLATPATPPGAPIALPDLLSRSPEVLTETPFGTSLDR
ncbi:MAG: arsinothricin resistance N-acetyltransferase ArsN1 family B [Alphaproteobacteria bacterium]